MQHVAKLARAPILFEPQGATKVAAFARDNMRLQPGQKCVVVSTATSAKRAAIVTHFLRRGGYFPLQCELPDAAPLESNVHQVIEAAKRTGSTFVAAYGGGSALSVGKAAAALLTNEGKIADYAAELGGSRSFLKASLPFLAVPSCPSGAELTREAHILFKGQSLATLKMHPQSMIGAVVDPALAVSLQGDSALTTAFATLVHCIEALLRQDSDRAMRALAFEGVQRAAYALGGVVAEPKVVSHRSQLAFASLISSALMAQGTLGACRGLGLSIAGRYNVPYSAAVTAIAPDALAASLDAALQKYDESTGVSEESDASQRSGGELIDESEELQPASKAMQKKIAKAVKEDAAAEKEDGGPDDSELSKLLVPYAQTAAEVANGGKVGASSTGADDDDVAATLVRFTRLGGVVHRAVDRAKALSAKAKAGSGAAGIPAASPSPFSLEPLGDDWRHIGDSQASASAESDLNAFRDLLSGLRAVGEAHGVHAPCLEDYKLTPLDLQTIAEAGEVEPNTLANVMPLRKSDLLAVLKAS